MAYLTQHLIDDILARLPVKTLLRFKCVSKEWYALISDPHFAKLHYKMTTQHSNPLTRTTLVVLNEDYTLEFIDCANLFDLDYEPKSQNQLLGQGGWGLGYLACSNGVVCVFLGSSKTVHIWNPATRSHRTLPSLMPKSNYTGINAVGFGYAADDYKVFALTRPDNIPEIFSLSTSTWRTVTTMPEYDDVNFNYPRGLGTYLNGAIHWVVTPVDCEGRKRKTIMAFDLANETYYQVVLPDFKEPSWIFVHEGCLCVVVMSDCYWDDNHDEDEMWIMKEYNKKESWIQILACEERLIARSILRSTTGGDQILQRKMINEDAGEICVYNLEKKTSRRIYSSCDWFQDAVNLESIASIYPKQINKKEKQSKGGQTCSKRVRKMKKKKKKKGQAKRFSRFS